MNFCGGNELKREREFDRFREILVLSCFGLFGSAGQEEKI